MIKYGSLKRFLIVWGLYWSVYFAQPVRSVYQDVDIALLIQLLFVAVLFFSYVVGSLLVANRFNRGCASFGSFDDFEVRRIIRFGFVVSFVGAAFLLYDKVFIQGVDYSLGLAEAREQWRALGEQREGKVSSVFSVLGYFFGGAYFLSLALVFSRFVFLTDHQRVFYILFGSAILMANSIATGGRSSILLAIAFSSFGYFSSKHRGRLFRRPIFRSVLWTGGVGVIVYIFYVFYSRAIASGLDLTAYSIDFLDYLGLEFDPLFLEVAYSSGMGGAMALLNLTVSYLTHSMATVAAIVQYSGEPGDVVFYYFTQLGSRLGLLEPPVEWFLAGRSPSLPGALYLQFGLAGMVSGAILLGVLSSLFCALFARHNNQVFLFFACSILESVLILSPFVFVGDLLFFPFVLLGCALLIFFSRICKA